MSEDQLVAVLLRERIALVAYIRLIVGDAHLADDLFQDVSIQAVQHRAAIESADHLRHWLRRAARHRAIDQMRTAERAPQRLDDATLDRLEARWAEFDAVPAGDLTEALSRCMGQLTDRARRIIQLRYADNHKSAQIARQVGVSVESVYKTITRSHQQLARCMAEQMQNGGGDGD